MPSVLGDVFVKFTTDFPGLHRAINKRMVSKYADKGVLPGLYSTKGPGRTSLWELLHKEHFALAVPKPEADDLADLPDTAELAKLFVRDGPCEESRISLLLPLFAQHLTDAVFQSDADFKTDAPHEIILNQIYAIRPKMRPC